MFNRVTVLISICLVIIIIIIRRRRRRRRRILFALLPNEFHPFLNLSRTKFQNLNTSSPFFFHF